jgi:hypothetical protein
MSSYKLHTFRTDGSIKSDPYKQKPTFPEMYKEIGCDMIQPSTAYLPEYSNRKDGYTEFYMDEEFLLKHPVPSVNILITNAWYKWQKKTGHQSIPGSSIHGNVCVIQKVKDDAA